MVFVSKVARCSSHFLHWEDVWQDPVLKVQRRRRPQQLVAGVREQLTNTHHHIYRIRLVGSHKLVLAVADTETEILDDWKVLRAFISGRDEASIDWHQVIEELRALTKITAVEVEPDATNTTSSWSMSSEARTISSKSINPHRNPVSPTYELPPISPPMSPLSNVASLTPINTPRQTASTELQDGVHQYYQKLHNILAEPLASWGCPITVILLHFSGILPLFCIMSCMSLLSYLAFESRFGLHDALPITLILTALLFASGIIGGSIGMMLCLLFGSSFISLVDIPKDGSKIKTDGNITQPKRPPGREANSTSTTTRKRGNSSRQQMPFCHPSTGYIGYLDEQQVLELEGLKLKLRKDFPEFLNAFRVDPPEMDRFCLRWLRMKKFDSQQAYGAIMRCAQWRQEFGVNHLETQTEKFQRELDRGKLKFTGFHAEGPPVLWMEAHLHIPSQSTHKEVAMSTVYLLEYETPKLLASKQRGPSGETLVLVVNLRHLSRANVDLQLTKYISDIFREYYPEMIYSIFLVDAPWMFEAIWTVVKTWIDPVTVSKIRFIKGSDLPFYLPPNAWHPGFQPCG